MTRGYARAPSSERAHAAVPFNPGPAITLVMALGLSGIVAPCAFDGAMNGHIFGLYMAEQVIPQLPPDAVVIVDNLSAHHSEDAREALEAHDFAVVDDPEDVDDEEIADALKKPGIQCGSSRPTFRSCRPWRSAAPRSRPSSEPPSRARRPT